MTDQTKTIDPRRNFAIMPDNETGQTALRDLLSMSEEIKKTRTKFEVDKKTEWEQTELYKEHAALAEKVTEAAKQFEADTNKQWEEIQAGYDQRAKENLTTIRQSLDTVQRFEDNRLYVIDATTHKDTGVALIVPNPNTSAEEAIQIITGPKN